MTIERTLVVLSMGRHCSEIILFSQRLRVRGCSESSGELSEK